MPRSHSLTRRLLGLAWPVALARLGIMGMGVVDAIVVGQLAPRELPHQALGWAPTSILVVTSIGLLAGVQVLTARALGEERPTHAGAVLRSGLKLALWAGALSALCLWLGGARIFTWVGIAPALAEPAARVMRVLSLSVPLHLMYVAGAFFLEAVQRPLASTWVMWGANLLNLGLNLLLVPRYGALGSAWATVGARGSLALVLLGYIFTMRDAAHFGARRAARTSDAETHAPAPGVRALLAIGVAAALSHAAEAGAFSGMTFIAGRIGEQAVAAYQIALNLMAVVFMVSLGLSTATAVLSSEQMGRGDARAAARIGFAGLGLNSGLMLLAAALTLLLRGPIGHAYTADLALAQIVTALLPWVALTLLPDGGQAVVASALRAQGDNWFPTGSHLVAYACVMPVLGFWLGEMRGQGVRGLLSAVLCASALSVGVLVLRQGWLQKRSRAL